MKGKRLIKVERERFLLGTSLLCRRRNLQGQELTVLATGIEGW